MKKYFYLLVMVLLAIQFVSCSNDDDETTVSELEKSYLSIEGATYNDGDFTAAVSFNCNKVAKADRLHEHK